MVQHWFRVPTFSSILVVLPLWLQPFFLQNLSYQYDGAGMALSLACAIWAMTLDVERRKYWLAGAVMIAAGAALYQPSVSVAAGLCGIEVIRQVMAGKRLVPLIRFALVRLGQLMAGTLLFFLSCSWMVASRERSSLLVLDGQWLGEMRRRLALTTKMVDLLLTPWISWLCLGLLAIVLIGLRRETLQLWRRPYPAGERLGLGAVLWLTIPLIVACIPGILLFLADFDLTPCTAMGLGVVLAMAFFFVHGALATSPRLRMGVLILALLPMLTLSFAYGRVLVWQKTLHQSITQSLAYDISSQPAIAEAKRYYVLGFWQDRLWVPAASGSLSHMPVIELLDPSWYVLLPEMLLEEGVEGAQVRYQRPPLNREQVRDQAPTPLLTRKLYDIHRVGNDAYVLIKLPQGTGIANEYSSAKLRALRFGWSW
nr:glucosyltransferase domain-containing protein [Pseudomonas putida]